MLKRATNARREHLPVHCAWSGTLRNRPFVAVANGAGPRRAYAAVGGPGVEAVCNLGFCGGLDSSFQAADIFVAARVNGEEVCRPRSPLAHRTGSMASVDHVVRTAAEKRSLFDSGFLAVEMEAAGALSRAKSLGLPFYSIRAVSDLAGETLNCDFHRALRDDGTIDVKNLAVQVLARPLTCLPELIRLGKRAALASERLGEFIASCEF